VPDLIPPPPSYPPSNFLPAVRTEDPPVLQGTVIYATNDAGPSWFERLRPGYNGAAIVLGLPLTAAWSHAVHQCAAETSLAGGWVLALVPLGIVAFADNVYGAAAHAKRWAPKIRAFGARVLLWVAVLGAVTALPILTIVYLVTGVRT
jgi:hypothetical protein